MCYAIPGRVIEVNKGFAVIDYFGERRKARNDFFELSAGEYIYAQGGFVIQKVKEAEALLSLEAWKELFFELKKIDNKMSRIEPGTEGADPGAVKILNRAQNGVSITKEEALLLFNIEDRETKQLLFKTANAIRQKLLSNACCVHGIIEFSNFCKSDCLYCGISRHNKGLLRYRMRPDEILDSVKEAARLGFKALVLQSGEDHHYTAKILSDVVRIIREKFGILVFLSVGERDREFYRTMFEAGARGVLLRFETSDQGLYEKIKPQANFKNRIAHLEFLKGMGYLIATGGLLGLPAQTKESLVDDIFLARSFGSEMYSFGPFIPHPRTPLKETKIISRDDVLKFIAITRLIVPDGKILVTTAMETVGEDMRRNALLSGANSFMLNVTPIKYRKLYEIYQNRAHVEKALMDQVGEAIKLLKDLGRAPSDLGIGEAGYGSRVTG